MDTQHDYSVFIGRFEPFHNGHLAVARKALEMGKKLIVIIGTANRPRTIKNPWVVEERAVMIRSALAEYGDRVIIGQVRDHLYNEDLWLADVQRVVRDAVAFDTEASEKPIIRMIGQSKDDSSYYLKKFPQWPVVDVQHTTVLSATDLRRYLFEARKVETHGGMMYIRANVPASTYAMIDAFRHSSPDYDQLLREYDFIKDYKAGWAGSPYDVSFNTADSVVTCAGHILLIKRKPEPGKGLWALPGGFIKPHQTALQASLAELREETRLKVPEKVILGSLRNQRLYDHPERSLRGRTFTQTFHYALDFDERPKVRGGDDAKEARWFLFSEALEMGARLFEDHLDIFENELGMHAPPLPSLVI
ncbi:hypothetical protein [Xanthomonas phage RTH11]|nr:hypothetical protein [Xanthomonas phage RTH11]